MHAPKRRRSFRRSRRRDAARPVPPVPAVIRDRDFDRIAAVERVFGPVSAERRRKAVLDRPSVAGSFRLCGKGASHPARKPGAAAGRREALRVSHRPGRHRRSDQQGLASGPAGPRDGSGSCGVPRDARWGSSFGDEQQFYCLPRPGRRHGSKREAKARQPPARPVATTASTRASGLDGTETCRLHGHALPIGNAKETACGRGPGKSGTPVSPRDRSRGRQVRYGLRSN
jgi:hypothetical protein